MSSFFRYRTVSRLRYHPIIKVIVSLQIFFYSRKSTGNDPFNTPTMPTSTNRNANAHHPPSLPPIAEEKDEEEDDCLLTPRPPDLRNFEELEDSDMEDEDDDDENNQYVCRPADPGGRAPRIIDPFKLITDKLSKKKKKYPRSSDDEIRIACIDKLEWLGNRGFCKNLLRRKALKCD